MNDIPLISWDSDPLTEQEVVIVEKAIGPLPTDYRQFLLTRNGGRTKDHEVRFPHPDTSEESFYVTAFTVMEPQFPPEVLEPVIRGKTIRLLKVAEGYDAPILMQLDGRRAGTIYYWDYQLEDFWDADDAGIEYLPNRNSMLKLAPSFTAFVDRLVRFNSNAIPRLQEMDRTVDNFAKYGDHFFAATKEYFDSLTLDELNSCWPRNAEYAFPAIHYAVNWSQVHTAKLLIDRGVETRPALTQCTNNFEIMKMMIHAGATDHELRELLFSAATSMAATSVPEEKHKIILYLVDRGIQPDFADPQVLDQWTKQMTGIYTKKILRFLLKVIQFPGSIANLIREKLARPS